ncbi:MAG TPA: ChaN family lipoprotein, partial [Stellaceae bacterium]
MSAENEPDTADHSCVPVGGWVAPEGRQALPDPIGGFAARSVVLLGETHTDAEHHRWQLQTVAALHGRRPDMVLGFEMFPRRVQPTLDRWVRGELSERAFLDEVRWSEVWGYDPALYMPLFHFARMHRMPMVALNVDRALVRRVSAEGWDAVPAGERE